MNKSILLAGLIAITWCAGSAEGYAGPSLDAVKSRGFVKCGVNQGVPGFSTPDSQGHWTGLDVDICRAIAAAIFGDESKVQYTPLSGQARFAALSSGQVDVLSRNTTWTITRDAGLGINFGPIIFYDGQGFMVRKSSGLDSPDKMKGATVCVQSGSTNELNIADYSRANGLEMQPVVFEELAGLEQAFFNGRCDVYSNDASALASARSSQPDVTEYEILPQRISKEPLAPAVRHGDDQWYDLVRWVAFAMIEAEELGITSKNVEEMTQSNSPEVRRFLGVSPGIGSTLGVEDKWAYNIVKQVGNYGESYDRNLGPNTPLKLVRGLNDLWTKGGLMYSAPFR